MGGRIFAGAIARLKPIIGFFLIGFIVLNVSRLGLAVSRKVDPNAVGRNRIKRVLRDAFRHLRPQLRPGAYVIVARAAARQADNVALRDCFDRLLKRACALPQIQARGTMPPAPSLPQDASAPIMAVEPGKPVQ